MGICLIERRAIDTKQNERRPKMRSAIKLFIATFLASLIIVIALAYHSHLLFSSILFWTAATTLLLYAPAELFLGIRSRCPSCHRLWARVLEKKEAIGRKFENHVPVKSAAMMNSRFRNSGLPDRPRRLITDSYENFYLCRYCSHSWITVSTNEYSS